jgi:hypothetical protein
MKMIQVRKVNNMQINYTLKRAVITALAILAIGAQNNASALGLGNINVKSQLGQPLRASIKIQDASEIKDEACFRVINDTNVENPLTNANFRLSKIVGDTATLTVTSNQIINEPITNLTVMAECGINIRRDYVLLLDPPAALDSALTNETETTIEDDASLVDDSANKIVKEITEPKTQAQTVRAANTSTKKTSSKKKKNSKKSNKNVVLSAGYNDTKPAEKDSSSPNNTANENKPRLSISGGEILSNAQNTTNLRLDKQLHFAAEAAPEGVAANIEMQDEVTVLHNRMMHLEKQINNLMIANQKLKDENRINTQQLEQASSPGNKLDWLGYILGGGLLLSGLTIAEKLRSRRQIKQLEEAELSFLSPSQTADNPTKLDDFKINDDYFGSIARQELANTVETTTNKTSALEPPKAVETPFSVEEFDSEHNILDHADVFLSHGRTSLAIQLLQNHLLDFPKQSVTIWLFLLDLLAKENMQGVYEQTALECKEHFNIRIEAFSNDEASPKQRFEDFPRLNAGLQDVWGTPAALIYLDDLIYNSRLETRAGFEKSVLEELLLLKSIAHEVASTATVIQLDEKKLALKELKEAQIAAKKAEKLQQMDELLLLELVPEAAAEEAETNETLFEFNIAEFK